MTNIILVDDESGQLEIMKQIIAELYPDFTILCFDNSRKALEYISSHSVDAVITDIKMPGLDGIQLAREISLLDQDIIVAIISAYNDFEYAQQAIRYGVTGYLIKPVSHSKITELFGKIREQISEKAAQKQHIEYLNSQLESYRPAYIEKQLKSWLNGTSSLSELASIQSFFKYSGCGIITAAQIHGASRELLEFLKIQIHQLFSPAAAVLSIVYSEENRILVSVIIGEQDLPLDFVRHCYHSLTQTVLEKYGLLLRSGSSAPVPDLLPNVPFYVKQALAALDDTFLNTNSEFTAHQDLRHRQLIDNTALYTVQNKVLDRFCLYDINGIQEILDSFCQTYVNRGYVMPSNMLQQYFINIIFLAQKHVKFQENDHIIEDIKNCTSIEELIPIIHHYLDHLMTVQHRKTDESTQQVIDSMKHYIDTHFAENITLEAIADQMHFNPNYIGTLFKQQFGIGFKEYLTNLRISRAKQLLIGTHLKIYEIAGRTGYSDVAYFIKLFRKETGVSPNKFRIENCHEELL